MRRQSHLELGKREGLDATGVSCLTGVSDDGVELARRRLAGRVGGGLAKSYDGVRDRRV